MRTQRGNTLTDRLAEARPPGRFSCGVVQTGLVNHHPDAGDQCTGNQHYRRESQCPFGGSAPPVTP